MRDALAFGGVAVVLTMLLVAVTALIKPREWPEVTPRILMCEPDFWHEKGVRLRTSGMETVGNELRFRTATDQPYCVRVTFKGGAVPAPTPAIVPGVCKSESGVVVVAAR